MIRCAYEDCGEVLVPGDIDASEIAMMLRRVTGHALVEHGALFIVVEHGGVEATIDYRRSS